MATDVWEYLSVNVLTLNSKNGWNLIGKDGWELVSIYTAHQTSLPVPIIAVFKRNLYFLGKK